MSTPKQRNVVDASVRVEELLRAGKLRPPKRLTRPRRPQPFAGTPAAFYVPVAYDPSELPPDQRDFARYFLNLLHWRYVNWRADDDGFVHLMWKYLTAVIPRDMLPKIRSRLANEERPGGPVVERDYRSAPGKANGYRLAPAYRMVCRVECEDPRVNWAISKWDAKRDRRLQPVHRWLRGHLDALAFDRDRALAVIATLPPDPASAQTPDEYRLLLVGQCSRLAGGDRYFVCDPYGRVHTPVTSLHRQLRCCLSFAGEPLVGLDLANSQPLFAGLLARRFCRSRKVRCTMWQKDFPDAGNPYCYKALPELADAAGGPDDLRRYVERCERGAFYEFFCSPARDRDAVKRGFMDILMGPNKYRGPVKAAFEREFPTVAGMLRDLKARDHRRASWLLQNLEATVFIHAVCGRLRREHPDLPVVTVHDCLFTVPDGIGDVRAAVLAEFARFGLTPTLKGG